MATILDTGFLNFLLPVFAFLLVYSILFGILQKSKFLTDSTSINTWVAFAISIFFLLAPGAIGFVSVIAPWFVVLVIAAFSLLLIFFFMGVKVETIERVAREEASVRWTIIIISIIILIVGLTSVFGPIFGTPADQAGGMGGEIQRSIFDPQVLTTVFILLVIGQAVRLIAQKDDD